MDRENWEYESSRQGWRFFLTIPDSIDAAEVEFIEGIMKMAMEQAKRRVYRVTKFDGFEVDEHETTESLLKRLAIAKAKSPKSAAEILSITSAIFIHGA